MVNPEINKTLAYRRIINRMGYYNYQRGLIFHHMDEEGSWNEHLRNSRNFILRSLKYFKPRIVTVLGSGWLLDLPLSELNEAADEVNLVDIVHPPEVREQVKDLKNVNLREDDITGGLIEEVWKKAGKRTFLNKLGSIDEIKIKEYIPQYFPGMVISLNVLTQLESLPVALLRRKSKATEERLEKFRKEIQLKHLSFLKKHRSVLITDFMEVIKDSSGKTDEISSLLADLPEATVSEEWTWDFDHKKSDYYRKKSTFRIKAILIEN